MATILCAAWFPGSANSIAPAIKRLREDGHRVVVIADKQAKDKFIKDAIDFATIEDFGVPDVSAASMREIIGRVLPNLVFVGATMQTQGNKLAIEQQLTLAARAAGIRTIAVLDMWGEYVERFSDIYTNERFKYLPDIICIPDGYARQEMEGLGFDPCHLVVTGNPGFDVLVRRRLTYTDADRRAWRQARGIQDAATLIIYASQPIDAHEEFDYGFDQYDVLDELCDAIQAQDASIVLLIKVHPREDADKMRDHAKGKSFDVLIDQIGDPRDIILASDLVVAPFSTMLIEACILGRPAISLQPGLKKEDFLVTNRIGATLPIYAKGGMAVVLKDFLHDPDFKQSLIKNQARLYIDGHATERVVMLVHERLALTK